MAGELILIVEDEARIGDVLEKYLQAGGYRTERAADGRRALELWRSAKPDLVLLDLMIPQVDGLEVLRSIRRENNTPVIVVTARVEEIDRLLGLELGADDYVTKPFSPREVVARVKAVLCRAKGSLHPPEHYRMGRLEVDLAAFMARCQGQELPLTPTHLRLLASLAAQPGRALSRAELLDAIGEGFLDERTVDAHVKNLRSRMGACAHQLETVRGVGYRLVEGPG